MAYNASILPPTNFGYSDCGKHHIDVYWTAATGTGYEVIVNGGTPITVSGTTYSITGLVSNRNYTVEVRTINGADFGDSTVLPNIRTGTYPKMTKGFVDDGYTEITTEPAWNVPYTNQVGMTERRVSDRATMTDDVWVSNRYAKAPAFNADSTVLSSSQRGGSTSRREYNTYDFNLLNPLQAHSTFMDYVDPHVSYWTYGNTLRKTVWDPVTETNSHTILYTFSDYDNCSGAPTEETKFSWDGKYVGLEFYKGSTACNPAGKHNATEKWAVVFNLHTNQIESSRQIGEVYNGSIMMSPSGKYMAVQCSSESPDMSFRVYKNDGTLDEMPYGDFNTIHGLGYTGHGDMQQTIQGQDCYVCIVSGRVLMYLFDTGTVVDLFDNTHNSISTFHHFSGNNCKQPGWIYVNNSDPNDYASTGYWKPPYRKIFAAQLDENVTGVNNTYVRVYAKYQRQSAGTCFANPDPTGQILTFDNFANNSQYNNMQMYVSYAPGYNFVQESPLTTSTSIVKGRIKANILADS